MLIGWAVFKHQLLHPDIANYPTSRHIDKCTSPLPIFYKIMPFFKINSPNPATVMRLSKVILIGK